MNQDAVVSDHRRAGSLDDPKFYELRKIYDGWCLWMNVNSNVGWYHPVVEHGVMTGFIPLGYPWHCEEGEEKEWKNFNWCFRFISPKQREKILALLRPVAPELFE